MAKKSYVPGNVDARQSSFVETQAHVVSVPHV
jgi:hypothetical protein